MSFEKKCVCTYNCDDLELLQTNREADNNKENILQVAENEDLLEIESGVPTKNPTKLYPKRDTTKLDRKDFEDYKEVTDLKINDKADKTEIPDLSEYAKKEDIPEEADLSNYATKGELNTKADKTEIPDLSEYAKKEDIPEEADLSNYATKGELNTKADKTEIPDLSEYAKKEDIPEEADLSNYATKGELNTKADKTEIPDLSEYAKKEDIPEEADLSNYATKGELNTKADKTEIPDLSEYAKKEDIPEEADLSNYATKTDLNLKADKDDLSNYLTIEDARDEHERRNGEIIEINKNLNLKANQSNLQALENYTKNQLNLKADKTEIPDLSDYAKKEDINLDSKADIFSVKLRSQEKKEIIVFYHIAKYFSTQTIDYFSVDYNFILKGGFSRYGKLVEFFTPNEEAYFLNRLDFKNNEITYDVGNTDGTRNPIIMKFTLIPDSNFTYVKGIKGNDSGTYTFIK